MILILEQAPKSGKGLWKLNTNMLSGPDYISLIKETMQNAKSDACNLSDKSLTWDFIKCKTRTESITYAIRKRRKPTKYLKLLTDRLAHLEELVICTPSVNLLEEISLIKQQIEDIYAEKARGAIVRSRCKFTEEYEKLIKYFLNLEKANNILKSIYSLTVKSKRISKQEDILDAQKQFYGDLYSELNKSNEFDSTHNYLQIMDLPHISFSADKPCESELTLVEVKKAIKELAINKTSGPDGLPNKFYKIFFEDISDLLYMSYIEAFKNGFLCESQRQGVFDTKKGKRSYRH